MVAGKSCVESVSQRQFRSRASYHQSHPHRLGKVSRRTACYLPASVGTACRCKRPRIISCSSTKCHWCGRHRALLNHELISYRVLIMTTYKCKQGVPGSPTPILVNLSEHFLFILTLSSSPTDSIPMYQYCPQALPAIKMSIKWFKANILPL